MHVRIRIYQDEEARDSGGAAAFELDEDLEWGGGCRLLVDAALDVRIARADPYGGGGACGGGGKREGGVSERRFAAAVLVLWLRLCLVVLWLCCAYVPGVLLPTPVDSVTPAARS